MQRYIERSEPPVKCLSYVNRLLFHLNIFIIKDMNNLMNFNFANSQLCSSYLPYRWIVLSFIPERQDTSFQAVILYNYVANVDYNTKECSQKMMSAGRTNMSHYTFLNIFYDYDIATWFHRPVTVDAHSKAWTVFARSNAGIVGSNPTQGTDVCVVCVYSVFLLFCV
jgi:hypothetical protein